MFRHTAYIRRLLLGRYLLVTNTVSSCALDALGDAAEQRAVECLIPHDWPRTLRMGAAGLLMGPVDHHWYRFLDSRYPGSHGAAVAKKVSLDILLYGPVAVVMFYLRECRPLRMRLQSVTFSTHTSSDVQVGGKELERSSGRSQTEICSNL